MISEGVSSVLEAISEMEGENMVTASQVAKWAGVSISYIARQIKAGKLPAQAKYGASWQILESDARAWIAARQARLQRGGRRQ